MSRYVGKTKKEKAWFPVSVFFPIPIWAKRTDGYDTKKACLATTTIDTPSSKSNARKEWEKRESRVGRDNMWT